MYYLVCIVASLAVQQVSCNPTPVDPCDHLKEDVKEMVQTFCEGDGRQVADYDASQNCSTNTYNPCPAGLDEGLTCLKKYLDDNGGDDFLMVSICSCLDAFKEEVGQMCRNPNFFNFIASNVKKVVDTVFDVSVHNTKKANQKVDDIEEILKSKYGLQSSILDKLRTITDPVRKQQLADKIIANLEKRDNGDNKNTGGWNKGNNNGWKTTTGGWKTTTTKTPHTTSTTTKKTTTTTTKSTTSTTTTPTTTTTTKPPFPCDGIDLSKECQKLYPFNGLKTEGQIHCRKNGKAIITLCEMESHNTVCYSDHIKNSKNKKCACFGVFEALVDEGCNPEVAVCTKTCPNKFHPSQIPPKKFREDCKAQGYVVVNDCEGDSDPDACYAAYLEGVDYGYNHVDELLDRDSISWNENSANYGKCTCWGLAEAKSDDNNC